MKIIIDFFMWLVWVPLRGVMVRMPRAVVDPALSALALFFYIALPNRRKGVREELGLLFGSRFSEKELGRMTRASFDNFIKKVYENLFYGKVTADNLEEMAYFEGLSNMDSALGNGKGAIVNTLHFGSYFLFMLGLGLRGYRANALTGTPLTAGSSYIKNKLFELRKKEEDAYPFTVLGTKDFLSVVRALKRNEIIGVAIDGREGANLVPVKFFDRTAEFSTGIISLAMKTGAAIIPSIAVKGPDGRHRLILEPKMELIECADKDEMLRLNLEKFIGIMEKHVLEHPDHYGMTLYSIREEARKGLIKPLFADNAGFRLKTAG
ncbi:MAG: lysophospholipid acyltransferase family protein [Deltaproteobacteria bacterium]|nr:lysophospholipid acyltransferase family protein [Deltaproteobacteria bacterium]